jgi:hypothetical protein
LLQSFAHLNRIIFESERSQICIFDLAVRVEVVGFGQ